MGKRTSYRKAKLSFLRRMTAESFDLLPQGHPMMGLLEIDVTELRKRMKEKKREGERLTFFSCLLKAVALSLEAYPDLNSMRIGRHAVFFDEVDINIPVEMTGRGETFPRQVIIRHAAAKSAGAIAREIEDAREKFARDGHAGLAERRAHRGAAVMLWLPRFLRRLFLKGVMSSPELVKEQSGTTFVTSVTGFSTSASFLVPYHAGPRGASFAIGNISKKVVLDKGIPREREMLSMTVVLNHDLVDGAPASRFVHFLQGLIENPDFL